MIALSFLEIKQDDDAKSEDGRRTYVCIYGPRFYYIMFLNYNIPF